MYSSAVTTIRSSWYLCSSGSPGPGSSIPPNQAAVTHRSAAQSLPLIRGFLSNLATQYLRRFPVGGRETVAGIHGVTGMGFPVSAWRQVEEHELWFRLQNKSPAHTKRDNNVKIRFMFLIRCHISLFSCFFLFVLYIKVKLSLSEL